MLLRGLRQARQRRGISIGQLAEATGLRRETIAHLEHGQEEPQPYALRRLEAALGASAADLCASPGASTLAPAAPYPVASGAMFTASGPAGGRGALHHVLT
jgi:transcriptional regulator with XRE-family HTH domain